MTFFGLVAPRSDVLPLETDTATQIQPRGIRLQRTSVRVGMDRPGVAGESANRPASSASGRGGTRT